MISAEWIKIICCPVCKGDLLYEESLYCEKCHRKFLVTDDIPLLISDLESKNNSQFEHQRKYFDKAYRNAHMEAWQKTYNDRIFKLFDPKQKKESFFLDIGAGGSGYTVIEAAKRGLKSVGCDLSFVGIKKAKYLAKKNKMADKTFWVVCNAEELPFRNATFNYICANAILEHLPNDLKGLQEMDRIAKEKSEAFITTPLKYKFLWPFLIPLNILHDKRIGHLRRYDEKVFEEKLKKTSRFRIVSTFYTGHLVKTLLVIISLVFRTHIFDKLAEKLDKLTLTQKFGASNISVFVKNYNSRKAFSKIMLSS